MSETGPEIVVFTMRDMKDALQRILAGAPSESHPFAEAQEESRCIVPPIGCGEPITGFRDELSEREYGISGLCQKCQDSVFDV